MSRDVQIFCIELLIILMACAPGFLIALLPLIDPK